MAKLNIHSTSEAESQSRFECGLEMALAGADCVPWEYPQVKSRPAPAPLIIRLFVQQ